MLAHSVAQAIVDRVTNAAGRRQVATIGLRIGRLSGLVPADLHHSFALLSAGTVCDGAALEIEVVPVAVACPSCDDVHELEPPQRFVCPVCAEPTATIVRGRELELVGVVLGA